MKKNTEVKVAKITSYALVIIVILGMLYMSIVDVYHFGWTAIGIVLSIAIITAININYDKENPNYKTYKSSIAQLTTVISIFFWIIFMFIGSVKAHLYENKYTLLSEYNLTSLAFSDRDKVIFNLADSEALFSCKEDYFRIKSTYMENKYCTVRIYNKTTWIDNNLTVYRYCGDKETVTE